MPTTLESVVSKYLRSGNPAQRTREEYSTTLRKWTRWGGAVPLEQLGRKEIRDFLDWVHEDASMRQARNPGRISNKVRSHLRAVMSWAWEQDIVAALPRFPKLKSQRDVAGRHYLTKSELNALYFATHYMKRPRGWSHPLPIGRYWRCALSFSSTMVSIQGRFGRHCHFMSRSFGGTCRGNGNRRTMRSRSFRLGMAALGLMGVAASATNWSKAASAPTAKEIPSA